jgi:ABC-three component (ABC-3C) system Middle Component 3
MASRVRSCTSAERWQEIVNERFWRSQPSEVVRLLNPAFCAAVLCSGTEGYAAESGRPLPFVLAATVLPIVLHKPTRDLLPSRITASFSNWAQSNAPVRIGLEERFKDLLDFTCEGMFLAARSSAIELLPDGSATFRGPDLRRVPFGGDVPEIIKAANFWGRWISAAGSIRTIFYQLGLRP